MTIAILVGLGIAAFIVVVCVAILARAASQARRQNEEIDKHWLARNELDYAARASAYERNCLYQGRLHPLPILLPFRCASPKT